MAAEMDTPSACASSGLTGPTDLANLASSIGKFAFSALDLSIRRASVILNMQTSGRIGRSHGWTGR